MKLKQRLYFLTMYNLSDIQKGIQCGHAALEYAFKYGETEEYLNFINFDKTWIILNGGISNNMNRTFYNDEEYIGSMELYLTELKNNNIDCAEFYEPDLNNSLTSICFLVDERVFDKKKYPDFMNLVNSSDFDFIEYTTELKNDEYNNWINSIGGEKNLFLRNFLKDKKLA